MYYPNTEYDAKGEVRQFDAWNTTQRTNAYRAFALYLARIQIDWVRRGLAPASDARKALAAVRRYRVQPLPG